MPTVVKSAGTAAFVLLVLAVALFASARWAGADAPALKIGSLTIPVAQQGTVDLEILKIPEPGLSAWRIGVVYDPAVVTAVACDGGEFGVCNVHFAEDEVIHTAAVNNGLVGDVVLGTFTFKCVGVGETPLTFNVPVFSISSSEAKDIEVSEIHGVVTCLPGPTVTPKPISNAVISVGSYTMHVGQKATVPIEALEIAEPGLGFWYIELDYDPKVVRVVTCSAFYGVCYPP